MALIPVKLQSEITKEGGGYRVTTDERRRAIVRVLCARKHETRENLAFEFNVGLRTIARDITALSFEYPIYTVTGPGGGVRIETNYEMRDGWLSTKEQAVLERLYGKLQGEDKKIIKSILLNFGKPKGDKQK